jgi:amino acid transporter
MSEEVHNAGLTVPRAMVWTILGNGTLGLVATVSFIFAVPNVHDALNHPSGFPIIYALDQVPGRGHTFTIALMALQLVILMVGNVGFQASVSRQTFAFARDRGLPFSNWIGHVNPKFHLPANAILLSATLSILVSLINLGSNTAFNAILSLGAVAAMGTFCISTTCLVYRRIYAPDSLPKSQWSLGKWGLPVNTVGALYSWFAFFWAFWPMSTPATVLNVNWAVVMFCGVVLLALVYYFWKARTTYKGPVTETEKWKEEHY